MTVQKSSYTNYVGIDVSKYSIEVGFINSKTTYCYENSQAGFLRLWKDHRARLNGALVVVETTGWYEKALLAFLVWKKVTVHRASARRVKQFILSYGTLAKTDAIDARVLAQYAQERAVHLLPYDIPDKTQDTLQILYARDRAVTKMLVQEKNRLQTPGYEMIAFSMQEVIMLLEKQLLLLEVEMDKIIAEHPGLQQKYEILRTVDGIGEKTARALIALMPELGSLNRKQSASLAGLAPHAKDSGKKKGYRKTTGGRSNLREIVHMAALGAIRKKNSKLKTFYNHLIEDNNKKKMVALTAVKRKIITIANARLAHIQINPLVCENHS